METQHVHNVYSSINKHFDSTRFSIWNSVKEYIDSIKPNNLVIDIGCGNGKYENYIKYNRKNDYIYVIACDVCLEFLENIYEKGFRNLIRANGLHLPYRENMFDNAFSIAVLHHIDTFSKRIQFMKEILRCISIGGTILITVWAAEQNKKNKWICIQDNDYFIPWLNREDGKTYNRFYHLFDKREVIDLIEVLDVSIESLNYERDNWCFVIKRIR